MKQRMLERSVLASVIAGDVLPSGLGLEAAHFQDALCRQVFASLLKMERERIEIDLTGLCMADDTLDAQAVVELAQERCVSVVIIEQNCAWLRERALHRALETLLTEALSALKSGRATLDTVALLRERLSGLLENSGGGSLAGRTMMELIMEVLVQMETHTQPQPIASGIGKIDEGLNGGFRSGDLAVIAALTSVGKSAMLAFMMRNAAAHGKRILLISCEMSAEQNAERYIAAMSGVALPRIIRRETLTEAENERISDGMALYCPENIRVITGGTQTVASIRREALRMKLSQGLDLIVVDYLQRVRPESGRGGSRVEETGAIAAGLKSLAVDLDVPVLTAAQFNREAAKGRSEHRGLENYGVPALHQLRDSSQIEDEANTVIVLDEPKRETESKLRRINAYISKNRSGALIATRLLFDPLTMTYMPADEGQEKE